MLASSASPIGRLLHGPGAPLGDVFAWLSALYFRGKLAYARAFADPPGRRRGYLVIAPGLGLRPATERVTAAGLRAMGEVEIESDRFRAALDRDAVRVARAYGRTTEVVLLGSIATGKYVDVLLEALGGRLVFPDAFVGRGDMSRGGLLLRAARSGDELTYRPIAGASRRGPRPPRLGRPPHAGLDDR
jgi:hypothetical protein